MMALKSIEDLEWQGGPVGVDDLSNDSSELSTPNTYMNWR